MKKEKYIKDVLKYLNVSPMMKQRIKEDLTNRIEEALNDDPFFDVIEVLGEPKDIAQEFSENINDDHTHIEVGFTGLKSTKAFEYKSEATLFGLPVIHVNTGGRYSNRVAKGIIAIGDVSFGVISLGGVGIGLFTFGGVGIGLIGLGGIGIGVIGIGGIAVGWHAIGGIAVGISSALGAISKVLGWF